jgi:hypothetical protein
MKIFLALAALLCVGHALQTNANGEQNYPAGNFSSVDLNAAATCTGSCVPVVTYPFEGGQVLLGNGATFSPVSTTAGTRTIVLPVGGTISFTFSAPQKAIGFTATANAAVTLEATAGAEQVSRAVGTSEEKVVFSVDAPYQATFTSIVITADAAVELTIPHFQFGETGFNCIGFETVYACELTVNLEYIPEAADISVYPGLTGSALYTVQNVGGAKVMVCVPETPQSPFQVEITQGITSFDSRAEDVNRPECGDVNHKCYLDPRAQVTAPVDCLPEEQLQLWYEQSATVSLLIALNGVDFSTLPLTEVYQKQWILAQDNINVGLQVGNGSKVYTPNQYNCGKGAVNPAVSPLDPSECQYPGTPDSLTGELVVRSKCSSAGFPAMAEDMTLYVTPVETSIQYTIPSSGDKDTRLCVINFGTYDIWATENGATTGILNADCANDAESSTCNGTPIDIVSAIYGSGCVQPSRRCVGDVPPVWPSAGGDSSGNYTVRLWHDGSVFREMKQNPFARFATCVLNLKTVTVDVPVSPGIDLSGEYDCTERQLEVLHPTENNCRRVDETDQSPLLLFKYLTVDLTGLENGSIDYNVNVVKSGIQSNLVAQPEGAFCNRGGAIDQVCVPAVGSDQQPTECGGQERPLSVQVYAEQCGATGNPSVCTNNKRRDDGSCIRTSQETTCTKDGICATALTQKLCIWDLLYLDTEYPSGSKGVVVEVLPPDGTSSTLSWENQGGSPRTYTILAGFVRVRISENPGANLPDDTVPHITSGAIQCQLAGDCVYNDFLSTIDLTGASHVNNVDCNDPDVQCSAISYQDGYSSTSFISKRDVCLEKNDLSCICKAKLDDVTRETIYECNPVQRNPMRLSGVEAELFYGNDEKRETGVSFRPTITVTAASNECPAAQDCKQAKQTTVVVLKTTDKTYGITYKWNGSERHVNDISCTGKKCDAVPCVVRWAAVDPHCPDLRIGYKFGPEGFGSAIQDDPNNLLYRYQSVVNDSPTARIGTQQLCQESISIGANKCSACKAPVLAEEFQPNGFADNTVMQRYFIMTKDGGDESQFTLKAGCAEQTYTVNCPVDGTQTGRKMVSVDGIIGGDPRVCPPSTQKYWHACSFGVDAKHLGPAQYWRTSADNVITLREAPSPVATPLTCNPADVTPLTDPWVPLSPYTVVSVDLSSLPDGNVPAADSDNITDVLPTEIGSQNNYRGNKFRNDSGQTTRVNPFRLSVCCEGCNAEQTRQAEMLRQKRLGPTPPGCDTWTPPAPTCPNGQIELAGGYDHLICILAGAEYSYTLEELYRDERTTNFLTLKPEPPLCPEARDTYQWNKNIRDCRPKHCVSHTTSDPIRYLASEWTNLENKLFDDINWQVTYSTNYQCDAAYAHTLLRPNRLARPAEADIPYIKAKWYEFRANSQFVASHSDKFTCLGDTGRCVAPDNDLQSTLPSLRSEPQE